jgi:Tol biopolymer transport system component/beta-lactamase regulating signal transducer with metallopeptidase domain
MTERIIVILINLSWQLAFAFAVSKLILTAFRIRSASIRHIVWLCVALSPLILLPMNMLTSNIVLLHLGNFYKPELIDIETNTNQDINLISQSTQYKKLDEPDYFSSGAKSSLNHVSLSQILNKLPLIILAIWSIGFGRGFIRLVFGSIKLKKLIQKAEKVTSKQNIFSEIKEKLEFSRNVYLLTSPDIQIPFSTGIIRSYVIIPSDMRISDDEMRMILIHELVHLKRFDNFVNIVCQISRAIMFFHPLYHLAIRELGLSSEQICDLYAVRLTGTREDYAQCLVDFSRVSAGFPVGFSASRKSMSKRVKFILEGKEGYKMTKKKIVFMLLSFAIIVFMLSAIRLINPASAKAQAPQNAQITFYSDRDGNYEIYAMDVDGNNQRRLTNSPAVDWEPAWSPDGQMIAFTSGRDGNAEIYVMDADGNNQRNLTNNPAGDLWSEWSPDGQMITFTSDRNGNDEIYVMDADGNNLRNLTNNGAFDGFSEWSHDGKRIAFTSTRDGNFEIYVMDADGNNQRRLTNNPALEGVPAWSPDDKMIAFYSERDGNAEIYVMDADGNNQRNLTNNPAIDHWPAWSPDGQMIAFHSYRDGNYEIYVMDVDGNNQRNLTNNPAWDSWPGWFDPAFARSVSLSGKLMSTWGWLKQAFH